MGIFCKAAFHPDISNADQPTIRTRGQQHPPPATTPTLSLHLWADVRYVEQAPVMMSAACIKTLGMDNRRASWEAGFSIY